jgi:hypothetical protein
VSTISPNNNSVPTLISSATRTGGWLGCWLGNVGFGEDGVFSVFNVTTPRDRTTSKQVLEELRNH